MNIFQTCDLCRVFALQFFLYIYLFCTGVMAWSPISIGFSQGKDDSCGNVQLFSRASFRNKYSSFSWTEDETAAQNKEVRINLYQDYSSVNSDICYRASTG